MTAKRGFVVYKGLQIPDSEITERCFDFYRLMEARRCVRDFSTKPVPRAIIETIIKTASTAPSGAHIQPWTFCAVSNRDLKHKIRLLAEAEERKNYSKRMSPRWKRDLQRLGTGPSKGFLDKVPWLIVVMKQMYRIEGGKKVPNYYVNESVGIATGFLIAAIHNAGLVTLTYTPSPMGFLDKLLSRPENERPFIVLPVGYPADDAKVPDLKRKMLSDVSVVYE